MKYSSLTVKQAQEEIGKTLQEVIAADSNGFFKKYLSEQGIEVKITGLLVKYIDGCDEENNDGTQTISSMGAVFFDSKNHGTLMAHFDANMIWRNDKLSMADFGMEPLYDITEEGHNKDYYYTKF